MNSELAFNLNGEPFDVPANAVGWRVRRMKSKGAPEVVYGRNGLPLVLPIEADLDDVRQETGTPGRYRLDPVDDGSRPIAGAPAGYVYVQPEQQPVAVTASAPRFEPSDNVVIEAMRMNSEIAKSVVDRFPQMLEAAAALLQAADGAGLPARQPRQAVEEDDDDDEDDDFEPAPASSPGFELINTLVAQVVPVVMTALAGKKGLGLAGILDWRKAAAQGQQAQLPTETPASAQAAQPVVDEPEELPPLDPKMMGHFIAIQSALNSAEAALARQVAAELSPKEMRAWFAELSALSVPDAVAKIRAFVGGQPKAGGAS